MVTAAAAAAATGAAASAFCPLYTPQRLFFTTKSFQVQYSLRAIPSRGFSFSLVESKIPVIITDGRRRPFALKASSQDFASDSNEEDEGSADELGSSDKDTEESSPSNLQLALSAYKEAIVNGDVKTISDVEAIIYGTEKEKNELLEKVSALSDEISSLKDRYIRLQADFDNYRKRSENEKLNIRSDAQGEVIESLLPMVDNFERAKQHLKLETEQEKNIDASYQGIYKQFVEIMKSLKVSAVPTVGSQFDPSPWNERIDRKTRYTSNFHIIRYMKLLLEKSLKSLMRAL
ncbi:OLC1v1015417C4 [Oldenlandia corymbosa var. corymbosa]|uniref:OLC1v1015417C4 n=1 Tax=Oldenlandia corymbosa var. corymbosa TaxID=529605 RepID=A0AAV1E5F3_OLDCO|nr:OLC1v1015417C4 [Oldenlandia corymbosa var. corymbosa]